MAMLGVCSVAWLTEGAIAIKVGVPHDAWVLCGVCIIAVVATDVPMMPHQLERLAKRGAIGIARDGTPGSNGSGDIFLAISSANPISIDRMGQINSDFAWTGDYSCDAVYLAAVQAIEESVINALVAAKDMTTLRPPGQRCAAINIDAMLDIIERYGQLRMSPR